MIQFFRNKVFTLKNISLLLIGASIFLTIRWALQDKFNLEPWTVIPQLILATIGILGNRKANEVNIELFKDFQRQLDDVSKELKKFNTKSALNQLLSLEKSIGDSTLPKKYRNRLYAELYYLKGKSNSDLGLNNEVYPNFIIAFNYQKQDIKLMERACTSHYFLGEKVEALKIANKILKDRPQNARAWAVKVADDRNLDLLELPVAIRVNKTFKNILATAYVKQGRYSEINLLLAEELNGIDVPSQIEYEDLAYWMLVCSVQYNTELKEFPNDILNRKDDSTGKTKRIQSCLILSNSILKLVEGSQLYRENKYYKQSYFIYNHAVYLVNNDRQGVLNMYTQFNQEAKSEDNFRLMAHLIPSLSQIKEYDKVISLCEANPHSQFRYTQILAFTYFLIGDFLRSCEYFNLYIKEVDKISIEVTENLIVAINVLYRQNNVDTRTLFEEQLQNKTYEQEELRNLIKAICFQFYFKAGDLSELPELLNFDNEIFDSLSENLKDNVCKTLTSIREFVKSNEYISRYLNEDHESQSLYLHIKNLYNLKSNYIRLLDLLDRWRKNFKPLYEFFSYELNILNELNMYAKIEEVSEFALKHFPDVPQLKVNLIQALDRQDDKQEKLKLELDQRLLKIPFHWEHAFLIGSICFKNNQGQLGLDLIFPYAKNSPDNPTIRQAYFGLLTMQASKYRTKKFEKVEIDTTVRINYNDEGKIIHINEITIANNKIAKALLYKKIGETLHLQEGFGSEVVITINDVLDKYSGLAAEIVEEVTNSFKVTGYQIKSITWKSNDIEDITKKFVKEFGADGELRKLTTEDAFNSYYDGKISFTELVRRVDQDKFFEIYETVTRNNSKGFIIPPAAIFNQIDFSDINEFVVDFSTLPILSTWKEIPMSKDFCFIVSQHLRDFVKDKINEISLLDDNPLTLSISLSGVQPLPYPPNYKANFIEELEAMIEWIDKNCKVGFAPEKLDILLKHPELIERNDWYFKYLIDTTFLANRPGRALVTDDLIYYKVFAHLAKPITLEHFIKKKAPIMTSTFMNWFLKNNYIGLTLSQTEMKKSFDESPIFNSSSMLQKCIKNLPFNWHKNEKIIFEIIDFAKYIYTHSLTQDYKLRIIETLFVEGLRGYPINPTSSKDIQQKIHDAFHLLGKAEMLILVAFTNALRILNNK